MWIFLVLKPGENDKVVIKASVWTNNKIKSVPLDYYSKGFKDSNFPNEFCELVSKKASLKFVELQYVISIDLDPKLEIITAEERKKLLEEKNKNELMIKHYSVEYEKTFLDLMKKQLGPTPTIIVQKIPELEPMRVKIKDASFGHEEKESALKISKFLKTSSENHKARLSLSKIANYNKITENLP